MNTDPWFVSEDKVDGLLALVRALELQNAEGVPDGT
jgi:hypothetical protein